MWVVAELDAPAGALRGVGDLDRLDVDAETVDVELGRGDQPPKVGGGVDERRQVPGHHVHPAVVGLVDDAVEALRLAHVVGGSSEEHTSELQSLMRISYAVFCLKKKKNCT